MLFSRLFAPTLRDDPAEAEIVSHRLMMRAGMLRKVAAGIYEFLPLGKRVLAKVERIVREEMDNAGAQEVLMPALQPAEVWQESGRWYQYGPEMMRLKDRHERDFCLGPTHEELITLMVKNDIKSYRRLPLCLYQIQVKFRDEIRPRFGLMRGREFIMKDAYSFDRDEQGMRESYRIMYDAYCRIVKRCGLEFRAVEAASGLIGGSVSQEFMVIAESGEDGIVVCEDCDYAANLEAAVCRIESAGKVEPLEIMEVPTPGCKSIEEVSGFLGIERSQLVKTLIYSADDDIVAVLIPGDREVNETKLAEALGAAKLFLIDEKGFDELDDLVPGFAGPIGLSGHRIIADLRVREMSNFVVGANRIDFHMVNANQPRDFEVDVWAEIVQAREKDCCPRCDHGRLVIARGIEVGHVFQLGTKYSEALQATFLDEDGSARPFVMGCYGIGVSRMVAAAIEQNHDERGICWPISISPFQVEIVALKWSSDEERSAAHNIYGSLIEAGIEVLLDDREESAGVKFADADLIGIPLQVIVGRRALDEGKVELKDRSIGETRKVELDRIVGTIKERVETLGRQA